MYERFENVQVQEALSDTPVVPKSSLGSKRINQLLCPINMESYNFYVDKSCVMEGHRLDFGKYAGKLNAQHINAVFSNVPRQLASAHDGFVKRYRFRGFIAENCTLTIPSDFRFHILWN